MDKFFIDNQPDRTKRKDTSINHTQFQTNLDSDKANLNLSIAYINVEILKIINYENNTINHTEQSEKTYQSIIPVKLRYDL